MCNFRALHHILRLVCLNMLTGLIIGGTISKYLDATP